MDAPGASTSVNEHRKLMNDILSDLTRLRNYAGELGLPEVTSRIENLQDHFQDYVFTVAVVGEFKRGKSTLINALAGQSILPTNVLPCSATLNRMTYGLKPKVSILYKTEDDAVPEQVEEIPIDQMESFITKLTPESEMNASRIKEAVVSYPCEYLKNKADIIDTPGLNDDQSMTDVTLTILPKADAAILVILAQSPFSEYEASFLNRLMHADMGRILFVVNRIDQIRTPEDRQRVVETVRQRIRESIQKRAAELYGTDTPEYHQFIQRVGEPRVFGISASQGLKAKLGRDDALLAQSGFREFEEALEDILVNQRGVIALQSLVNSSYTSSTQLLNKVTIQRGALNMEADDFEAAYRSHSARLKDLHEEYERRMAKIDAACSQVQGQTRHLVNDLKRVLSAAAAETIESFPIQVQDLEPRKQKTTAEKMLLQLQDSMHSAGETLAEKVRLDIERAVVSEAEDLGSFINELRQVLGQVQDQFSQVSPDKKQPKAGSSTDAATTLTSVAASYFAGGLGIGGAIAGYREGGLKGAAAGFLGGNVAGWGTTLGIVGVSMLIGLPVTWPVLVVTAVGSGIASMLGGKWAARLVAGSQQVEKFKENTRQQVFSQIDQMVASQGPALESRLEEQVSSAFEALKRQVQAEMGDSIEQTQKTLDDLRTSRSLALANKEYRLQQLAQMEEELQNIQEDSLARSQRLQALLARS